ncbi:LysR substrate-binding domain-containing protein [Oryzicola mucosus]|uniref:LysR family transcriptional regulator n=1 Tax=Oryzicola mucosus TaxID=2767425 RepID=A0A8J6TWI3_9HYPH|nr:LysR substrate-binding domain-containing protein [Oryzicola mucosus]MBD0413621.1 LysR family transcriptional regulator [Oryzicola mucosus]
MDRPDLLPPLTAVRAFHAVARHLSFTKAAEELGMTQAAVSYQIKVLEDRVGSALFLRKPRQIELTEAGLRLQPGVAEAFALITDAYAAARGEAGGILNITSAPTFASNWLARRIGSFQMSNPKLAVRFETSGKVFDLSREGYDVAIRTGFGDWPGMARHMVMKTLFTPMLSPSLLQRAGPLDRPADLLKLPILDPSDPWWERWFDAAGLPRDGLHDRPANNFGSQALEANAAIAGNGVAILTPAFVADELRHGRLVQPFDIVAGDEKAHWLVYPEARRNVPKIKAFREWLLAEADSE